MEIRPAVAEDLAELRALALAAWQETYRGIYSAGYIREFVEQVYTADFHADVIQQMASGEHFINVLLLQGVVSGIVDFENFGGEVNLMRVYLHPDLVGQGWGTRLLDYGEEELRGHGHDGYFLQVHARNHRGIRFYEKRGGVRVPDRDDAHEEELCYRMGSPAIVFP